MQQSNQFRSDLQMRLDQALKQKAEVKLKLDVELHKQRIGTVVEGVEATESFMD